jgi:uncharacterized protein
VGLYVVKTVLVTGASSGIGEAFARKYAELGHRLILVARSQDKLGQLANELIQKHGIPVRVIVMDVSQDGAAQEIYRQTQALGYPVDVLVNNAGFGVSGEFLKHEASTYLEQIKVNISAVVELTHLYLPGMVERGGGTIVNLASLLAFFPFPYCAVYSATKAFVLSFTESLWEEYRDKGIKVLALCPGPTDTNFFKTAQEVETRSKRTAAQVVHTAMKALRQNRSFVIDGGSNYMTALLGRLLPRRNVVQLFGAALRRSMQSKQRRS